VEQKQGLQHIEEERKLRQKQQYEEYCSFLEEQKHQFYLQQEQLYEEQEGHTNGHSQGQSHLNGRFQKRLNEYEQEQQCVQSESVHKHNLKRCVQEQGKYNADGCIQEHSAYQFNGYLQEQSQHVQEYQLTNDADQCHIQQQQQYQYTPQQFAGSEHHCLTGRGEECPQRLGRCNSTDRQEDVPLGQIEQFVGQQETEGGGRLFCIVGPTGSTRLSTYTAMPSSVGSSEGEY
jgi:hypothetical protein